MLAPGAIVFDGPAPAVETAGLFTTVAPGEPVIEVVVGTFVTLEMLTVHLVQF